MPQTQNPSVSTLFSNEQFLRQMAGADGDRVKVTFIPGDPETAPRHLWQGHAASGMLKMPLDQQQTQNAYFSVGVQSGTSRGLAGFEKIYAIVLDDVGPKVDLSRAEAILGPPSYVLMTSPGNCQAGWFTEITDQAWALGLVTRLHAALGHTGDNLKNLVGYMRLPIGSNCKPKLGQPFPHRMVTWSPHIRLKDMDWHDVEDRIGKITPIGVTLSRQTQRPDVLEYEDDVVFRALSALGRVQGMDREMTFGWGFDVECPWAEEHSDRVHEGASYVPVKQLFRCHHGHCQDRTMSDVRDKLNELLRGQGLPVLAQLEFDEIDPKLVQLPIISQAFAIGDPPRDLWAQKDPPPWPGNVFPAVIEDVLFDMAQRNGLDLGALGATMMTAASGAADKRTILYPYAKSDWQVRPTVWTMLVAETGQRKTAVLSLLDRLRTLNLARMQAYARDIADWNSTPKNARGPAPTVAALLAEDATVERLQTLMADQPRGMLYLRDELAALFGFGRYANGNGNNGSGGTAERAFFLETYEGGPTTVARMNRTTVIENCALVILGGMQQQRLAEFDGLANDGLLSRLSLIVQDNTGEGADLTSNPPGLQVIDATLEQLLHLGMFEPYRTDAAGEALIREMETDCRILAQQPDIELGMRGFLRKLHGTMARVALILHLIDGGADVIIPADTVTRAQSYARFLLGHAIVFYNELPDSRTNTARAIGSYLLRRPDVTRITAGRLRSDVSVCRGLKSLKEIQDAVFPLVMSGWLKAESTYPSNNAWAVRRGLSVLYAERAAAETARVQAVVQAMNRQGLYR